MRPVLECVRYLLVAEVFIRCEAWAQSGWYRVVVRGL